jgi:transposase InsO family protein
MAVNRSTLQYRPRPDHDAALREQLRDLAHKKRRRGSVKAYVYLRQKGEKASRNRGHRVWKQEKLQVTRRSGKKRKRPDNEGLLPLEAAYPGHVWSYDFLFDATSTRTRRKMLTVGDDFTRQCLAIAVATWLPWAKVMRVLRPLFAGHGAPKYLRSDHGAEFIAHALQAWLACEHTQTDYMDLGSPWQNGFRESFHGHFTDESSMALCSPLWPRPGC